jgi:hypothetical protein
LKRFAPVLMGVLSRIASVCSVESGEAMCTELSAQFLRCGFGAALSDISAAVDALEHDAQPVSPRLPNGRFLRLRMVRLSGVKTVFRRRYRSHNG